MSFRWRNEWATPAKVGVASLAIGGGLGYLVAKYRFDKELDQAIDAVNALKDRIDEAQDAERELHPLRQVMDAFAAPVSGELVIHDGPAPSADYRNPQEIIDRRRDMEAHEKVLDGTPPPLPRRVPEEATEHRQEQRNLLQKQAEGYEQPDTQNVFTDDTWDQAAEEADRGPDAPYVISLDEFVAKEKGLPQETLEWYTADQVLCTLDKVPVHGHERVVGRLEFGRGSRDPDVVYIRNEQLRAEYEIVRMEESFTHAVYGAQAEEAAADDELKHSDRIRRFRVREVD